MASSEQPRVEDIETDEEALEWRSLRVTENAVSALEANGTPETSGWTEKAKDFFSKDAGKKALKVVGFGADVSRVISTIGFKAIWSILRFAKEAVMKKGNVGFMKGYELGKDILSFEEKKGK